MKLMSISQFLDCKQDSKISPRIKSAREWGLESLEMDDYTSKGFFVRRGCFDFNEIEGLHMGVKGLTRVLQRELIAARTYVIEGNPYAQTERSTIQFEREFPQLLRVVEPFSVYDFRLSSLLDDSRLIVPMREITNSACVSVFTDKLNFKSASSGSAFAWHQDTPYWAHTKAPLNQLGNVMIALDDSTEDNGCLRVYTGSHSAGILPRMREGRGRLSSLFTDVGPLASDNVEAITLQAGDMLFFNPHLVHGSFPNISEQHRRALVVTYQPGEYPRFFNRDTL